MVLIDGIGPVCRKRPSKAPAVTMWKVVYEICKSCWTKWMCHVCHAPSGSPAQTLLRTIFFKVLFLVILDPHVSGLHPLLGPIPSDLPSSWWKPSYLLFPSSSPVLLAHTQCVRYMVNYCWSICLTQVMQTSFDGSYPDLVLVESQLYCLCIFMSAWNNHSVPIKSLSNPANFHRKAIICHGQKLGIIQLLIFVASKIPFKNILYIYIPMNSWIDIQ